MKQQTNQTLPSVKTIGWILTKQTLQNNDKTSNKKEDLFFRQRKKHTTFNYRNNPTGPLGYGLQGTCIEKVKLENKNLRIPTILVANITKGQSSKRIALTVTGTKEICNRKCFRTQIPNIFICLETTQAAALINTDKMNIEKKDLALSEIGSNAVAHLQINIDSTATEILLEMCRIKKKQLLTGLRDFNKEGLPLLFTKHQRPSLMTIVRREAATILRCKPQRVIPTNHHTACRPTPRRGREPNIIHNTIHQNNNLQL